MNPYTDFPPDVKGDLFKEAAWDSGYAFSNRERAIAKEFFERGQAAGSSGLVKVTLFYLECRGTSQKHEVTLVCVWEITDVKHKLSEFLKDDRHGYRSAMKLVDMVRI